MHEQIRAMLPELISLRRTLHQNPELGFAEHRTAALAADVLQKAGLEVKTGVAKTGVVGLIRGAKEGKTLLLRADMDALPMEETASHRYASRSKGVMHACGHDVHTAILLGVGQVLSGMRDRLWGNVKLVFQPAEEAMGGAKPMIGEGVMDSPKVDAAAAFHVWDLPSGTIGIRPGAVSASPDHFSVSIEGRGGHGAMPHLCKNPVAAASAMALAINGIREEAGLATVCALHSGTGTNIIPDTATLLGTARALDPDTRQRIYARIAGAVKRHADDYGVQAHLDYSFLYPPGYNDPKITGLFAKSAEKIIGKDNILLQKEPDMIGDDFAYFARLVPACYVKLGGATAPLHTASFDFDEACIATGVEVMCRFALDFLSPGDSL